jgi:predicted DNA-binding transcriptional regulator YafY
MEQDILNRFDRILAIWIQLQANRVVKAQDLSQKFGVSLRTIYRDIRSLEAAGIPIIGEAGVGYSIMEGYRLPPVMFTREEAASFIAAEKLTGNFLDKSLGAHFQSAMEKIKMILHGPTQDHISAIESHIRIHPARELFHQQSPDAMKLLLESIAGKTQLHMSYQAAPGKEYTERHVEPVGIFFEHGSWYFMGYCHLRKEYRQFRTDRIHQLRHTLIPFHRAHPPLEDLRKKESPEQDRTRIVLRMDSNVVKYICSSRIYYGLVSEKEADGMTELTFMTHVSLEGFARWFLMFADAAEIVEPIALKEVVQQLLEQMLHNLQVSETLAGTMSSSSVQ